MTTTKIKCSCCGELLKGEELESPRLDPDNDQIICDECYHEHYEFTCCCCEEYADIADQDSAVVLFEETSCIGNDGQSLPPGVYQITGEAYYCGCLNAKNLKRVSDIIPGISDLGDGYCGYLCAECQGHVLAQFTGKCKVCSGVKPSCLRVKLGSWKDFEACQYQWTRAKVVCADCRHAHRGAWKRVQA